jgi:hypothetical protein
VAKNDQIRAAGSRSLSRAEQQVSGDYMGALAFVPQPAEGTQTRSVQTETPTRFD